MLRKNRLSTSRKVFFRPEMRHCPHCEKKLQRSHTAWHKKISTLDGVIDAWSMAYACKNPIFRKQAFRINPPKPMC
jgi:hypothetical protein